MSETLTIILSILGINIALFGAIGALIVWAVNKLTRDVKGVCARLDGHATRIDQLYKMFVDLLAKRN